MPAPRSAQLRVHMYNRPVDDSSACRATPPRCRRQVPLRRAAWSRSRRRSRRLEVVLVVAPRSRWRRQSLRASGDVLRVVADRRRAHGPGLGAGGGSAAPDRRGTQREARGAGADDGRDRRDRAGGAARPVRGRGQPLAALVGGRGLHGDRTSRRAACSPGRRRSGVACITLLHAGGAAAARAMLWERQLDGRAGWCCPTSMPCAPSPPATGAGSARRRALLAVAHAVNAALIAVFTELTSAQSGTLLALTVPALLIPMLVWYGSLRRRTAAIERYFDVAVRNPAARGPAREDPDAVAAFRAAQGLPYRLAGYQALACAFAVVAVAVIGRKLCGFDAGTAGRLLGASALMLLAMALYETLLLRDVLRPLLAPAGRAPPTARRRGPRADHAADEAGVLLLQRHRVHLGAGAAVRAVAQPCALGHAGSIALALALALGLVLLIVRDMVNPVRALEERSDEMARGELARPVPPSGEADEIGRLTLRVRGDAPRAARQAALDRIAERRPRARGPPPHRGARAAQRRAARRAREAAPRAGRPGPLARSWPRWGAWSRASPTRSTTRSTRSSTRSRRSRRRSRRWPPARRRRPRRAPRTTRRRCCAWSSAAPRAARRSCRRCTTTRAATTSARASWSLARSVDDTLDLLRHRLRNVRVEKQIEPGAAPARLPRPDRSGVHEPDHERGPGDRRARARRHDPHRGRARAGGRRRDHRRRRRPGHPRPT